MTHFDNNLVWRPIQQDAIVSGAQRVWVLSRALSSFTAADAVCCCLALLSIASTRQLRSIGHRKRVATLDQSKTFSIIFSTDISKASHYQSSGGDTLESLKVSVTVDVVVVRSCPNKAQATPLPTSSHLHQYRHPI